MNIEIFWLIPANWLFSFDGGCPLCQREFDFFQSKNKKASLKFFDINSWDFSLELEYEITYKQAMKYML